MHARVKCVSIKRDGVTRARFCLSFLRFPSYSNTARNFYPRLEFQPLYAEEPRVARLILTRRNFLMAFVAITNLKFSSRTERVHLKGGKVGLWSRGICTATVNVIVALAAWSNYHPRKERKRHCRNPNISLRERPAFWNHRQLDRIYST